MEKDSWKCWQRVLIFCYEHWHLRCNTKDQNALPSECCSVNCGKWASGSQSDFEWPYHHYKIFQRHVGRTPLKIILCSGHKRQSFHQINDWGMCLNCADCMTVSLIRIFYYKYIYFLANSLHPSQKEQACTLRNDTLVLLIKSDIIRLSNKGNTLLVSEVVLILRTKHQSIPHCSDHFQHL